MPGPDTTRSFLDAMTGGGGGAPADDRTPPALLAAARQQFTTEIERGLGGRSAHARFSDRLDELIGGLVAAALADTPVALAVVALGGYGRRALSLHSDVDLLIVFAGPIDAAGERVVKAILHPLWDLGLRVGHQVRTVDEALAIDDADPHFLLAQVDARLLAGDPAIFARVDRRAPGLAGATRDQVIEALLRLTNERHRVYDDTIYQLEPDVKEAPGGLRDIVAARLLATLAHDPAAIDEDALEQAENFVLRVRSLLHLHGRRNANVLSHELQEHVADVLRFPGADARQRVEALMSRWFAHARAVARALETATMRVTAAPPAPPMLIGANIQIAGGRAGFIDAARAAAEPATWIELFARALEHGASLSPDALALIEARGSRYALSDLLATAEARRRFVRMLAPRRGLYATLTAMHDCGLLGRLLAGFGRIRGRVIRDFYHKYTVDEHTLLAIRGLERLLDRAPAQQRYAGLLAELRAPQHLVLALLLHDIGKWKDDGHAEESLRMAQAVLDDFGLPPEARHDVEFLVGQHLQMSQVTFRRDSADPQVIRQFAALVGTEPRLKKLCLLTLVDIDAVGPGVLTPWKEELLWETYVRTYNQLVHAYADDTIEPGEAAVAALEAGRPADLEPRALSQFLAGFPRRYLTSVAPAQIYQHARLAREVRARGTVRLLLEPRGDVWELAVAARDQAHLFANICGTLAWFGMDILRGSAMTSTGGLVLDVFQFVDREFFLARNLDGRARFAQLLQDVVAGRESIADRLARKDLRHRRAPLRVTPVVDVDNEASQAYTILEIVAQDAPGLLHRISRTVSSHGCDVDLVLIDTEGNKAIDVFHLTQAAEKLPDAVHRALAADLERTLQEGS